MSVLVYADNINGICKKGAFEAVSYAKSCADALGVSCVALSIGKIDNLDELCSYGADKVVQVASGDVAQFDSKSFAQCIADVSNEVGANLVVLSHASQGKALAGRLAVRLDAGLITGVNAVPSFGDGLKVTRSLFSGKASAMYKSTAAKNVLTLMGNSFPIAATDGKSAVEASSVSLNGSAIEVLGTDTVEGEVPLPEAEVVVSAGRGMKGPENWGIIEELAKELGATTACSRPVADIGWRPHHEHVGQTGIAIRPNLYIAAGISGAIQHLAGVNNSKVIVVINKDPEAPFFKAADYGVVGDLFDVVPRLTAALRAAKG